MFVLKLSGIQKYFKELNIENGADFLVFLYSAWYKKLIFKD